MNGSAPKKRLVPKNAMGLKNRCIAVSTEDEEETALPEGTNNSVLIQGDIGGSACCGSACFPLIVWFGLKKLDPKGTLSYDTLPFLITVAQTRQQG